MSWAKPIPMTPHAEFLVVSAVRYARGRATYVVEETCTWVMNHWDELSDKTKTVIHRDVAQELQWRREVRDTLPGTVDLDTPFWEALLDRIEEG